MPAQPHGEENQDHALPHTPAVSVRISWGSTYWCMCPWPQEGSRGMGRGSRPGIEAGGRKITVQGSPGSAGNSDKGLEWKTRHPGGLHGGCSVWAFKSVTVIICEEGTLRKPCFKHTALQTFRVGCPGWLYRP